MPKLLVGLLLVVIISFSALALADARFPEYLTAAIAVTALLVSVLSAFKEDVFPFRPRVLLDEVVLAAPTGSSHDSPAILLPLAFLNEGYGSGVVEGLTLKVTMGANSKVYTPVSEIDYAKFISGKRAIHAENVIGAFNIFPLAPRATLKKCILFTQEEQSIRYPFSTWAPAPHVFRLYLRHTASKAPVEVGSVTNDISAAILKQYKGGISCSLSPGRELHV
jgi:hypothetical protein